MEKDGKDRVSGELKKTLRGAVDAPPRKTKINNSDDYEVKNTQEICVSIDTRPKEHPSETLKGKIPKIR